MLQVISTYSVRDVFRAALMACPDITPNEFPYLAPNKKGTKTSGNISKILRQAPRRFMIFIARLFLAHNVMQKDSLGDRTDPFTFETYPSMGDAFKSIESDLADTHVASTSTPTKSVAELIHSIRSDQAAIKKRAQATDIKLSELEKKVKQVETFKKRKSAGSNAQTELITKFFHYYQREKEESKKK
jgi:hypothetical protein